MGVLLNGWQILTIYKGGVILFFVSVLGLGGWGTRFFQIDDRQSFALKVALSLNLGSLILIGLSFAVILLGRIWEPALEYGSILVPYLGLAGLVDWIHRNKSAAWNSSLVFFCAFFLVNLLVRLAFLKGIILPPYDDSPEHYTIVRDFLAPGESNQAFYSLSALASHYYHFGFHSLAAWLSSAANMDPADAIALLGQLFLVILPCSIFVLTYSATQNSLAGFVALSFSAFAWRMPAFASNWGKYPAIAGLSLFPAVLGLWILYWRAPEKHPLAKWILTLATLGLVFIHARLVICLAVALIGFLAARKLTLIMNMNGRKAGLLALLSVAALIPFWDYLKMFYDNGYFLALILVTILLPFAFYVNTRLSLCVALFILGAWMTTRLSILIGGYPTPLLDQPFVATLLCIPLSIFGGTGAAAFLDKIPGIFLKRIAALVMSAVIALSFVSADPVYPDAYCNYVSSHDMQAIKWLDANIPADATVWIAAFKPRNYMIATDAGAWVYALTGRNVNKLNFNFDWNSSAAFEWICRPDYEIVYIYKGGTSTSFSEEKLTASDWLAPVFVSGQTKIYTVTKPCVQR